jgi:hypothetical protein
MPKKPPKSGNKPALKQEPKKTSTSFRDLQNTSSALKKNQNKPAAQKSSAYRGLDERSKADLKASSKKMGDRVVKPSAIDKAGYNLRMGLYTKGFNMSEADSKKEIRGGGLGSNVARSKKK